MNIKKSIDIELVDSATTWNREMTKYPYTTYFHSWEWGMLSASTFGWEFRPYKLISSSGTFYCGVFVTSTGLSAGPIGYGGILAEPESEPNADEWLKAVEVLEEAENQEFQRIIFPPFCHKKPVQLFGKRSVRETSMVSLPDNMPTLWNEVFSGTARTSVRAATKRGVKVCISEDPSSVDVFYPIYEESMHRVHSSYRTPRSLIKALVSQGVEHVWFITATYNDEPVSCNLLFHFGLTVFHWINAYSYELRNLYANAAMLELGFSLALERRAKFFNLGASSTTQQVFSKSHWGAHLEPYYVYDRF